MSIDVTQMLIRHYSESHDFPIIGNTFEVVEPILNRMYNIGLVTQNDISEFQAFMATKPVDPFKL